MSCVVEPGHLVAERAQIQSLCVTERLVTGARRPAVWEVPCLLSSSSKIAPLVSDFPVLIYTTCQIRKVYTFLYSKAGLPGSDPSTMDLVYPSPSFALASSTDSTSASTRFNVFFRYGRISFRTADSENGKVRRKAVSAPNCAMRFWGGETQK
jgi:hypothetical protein